jgi:hypothetical protein
MKAELESIIKPLAGKIGVYYKDLVTGLTIEYNADEPFIAASIIKLPILVAVLQEIEDGNLRRDDVGIIYSQRPFILCFASNNTDVVTAEAAIKTVALHCYSRSVS